MNLLLSHSLLLILICIFATYPQSNSNHNSLVFKNCPESSTRSQYSQQTLSTLFKELVSRSSESKYFKTSETGEEEEEEDRTDTAVSGVFQCRGDITGEECRNCVGELQEKTRSLCGGAESARVQLRGCYVRYEPERKYYNYYSETSTSELLHKTCGDAIATVGGGFEEMRDAAFSALEEEIVESGGGRFCKTRYELVGAEAECEGGTEACECGECVGEAVNIAREQCGTSFSGEIYMDKCFLGFSYYPQGVPSNLYPGRGEDKGGTGSTGKIVAIVLGGAAALGFGLIFMLFIKSWTKKDDED